jgi:hypothetical protein
VESIAEPARCSMEIDLQAAIGPAYMATVGWAAPEVERSSARLRDLAIAAGDSARLFDATWGLWTVHFLRGKLDRALDAARLVLEMAMDTGDPEHRVAGHHAVGYTHFYRGEYTEAIRHAAGGLEVFDLEREKHVVSVFQLSSSCAMWHFRGQSQRVLGHVEEAFSNLRSSQALAEELRHAPSRAYLQCMLYYFFRLLDDVEQVKVWAPATRSLSSAEGFALWAPLADIFLAWTSAREGADPAAAAEKIRRSMARVHYGLTYITNPDLAVMHVETLLLAHRPEEALRVAREALAIARAGSRRHGEPELLRLQGEAATASGNREAAATFYRQGIESARSLGARPLELRCALALAQLTGGTDAYAELRSILSAYADGFDQPDFKQALALIETMNARPERE